MRKLIVPTAVAAFVVFAQPLPALSQNAAQPAIQVPLQDLPTSLTLGERLGRLWGSVRDSVGLGPSAIELANRYSGDSMQSDDFNWLMGIAGFKLKSIESTISLFPGLTLEFGQSRELSEADREFLERALERHARRNPGPIAAIQRMIVEGILEANEIQGFSVEKLTVTLLPLPYVKFTLAPSDAPLGPESSRILRAIERLNQRLQPNGGPRAGGSDADFPPPPMLRRAASNL